ncbi:MAG: hypothetical protein ACRDVM_04205 [Acidimicrobiia bacterium]
MLGFTDSPSGPILGGPAPLAVTEAPVRTSRLDPPAQPSRWDSLPSLADMRSDPSENTGLLVAKLWRAVGQTEGADDGDWAPNGIPADPTPVRWGVVLSALVLAALVVVGVSFFVARPGALAEEARQSHQEALANLRLVLPEVEDVIVALAAPRLDGAQIAEATGTLARLDGAVRAVSGAAAAWGSAGRDDPGLQTSVARSERLGATAVELEHRLGDALSYRLAFEQAFAFGELPVTPPPEGMAILIEGVGATVLHTEQVAASLPSLPGLDQHRRQVANLVGRLAEWQSSYLEAVRNGERETAGRLADDLAQEITALRWELLVALDEVAAWGAEQIKLIVGEVPAR